MSYVKFFKYKIDSLEHFISNKQTSLNEVHLTWLGQAGFIIRFANKTIIIDPYLSDYLSKKYKGSIFPHIRLMTIPIIPEEIRNVDYVIISHAHSDHMDPETLTIISDKIPTCRFIIPAAEIEEAINRGVKREQIIPCNDGQTLSLHNKIKIIGIASSHETLKINSKGQHHFLGYVFQLGEINIYHSGDCIPYKGLNEKIKTQNIDLALLPINGRDDYRASNNIAGNFLIPEVLELCKVVEIPNLIVHHFGMFAYNTVKTEDLEDLKQRSSDSLQIVIPEINYVYKILRN